jgi:N-succinyl-L-ornithine transcarbamylase
MNWMNNLPKERYNYSQPGRSLERCGFCICKKLEHLHDYGKIYTNDPKWMLKNKRWQVTNNAKVMHCLPVRRNVELSDEILDGSMSIVTQQAANRVWAAQAVLSEILKSNG